MKRQRMDIIVIGFALFAMFFGAGNMIFPPLLGLQTGTQWLVGFGCFTFADAGLALITILAMVRSSGSLDGITSRNGHITSLMLGLGVFLCVGPLMAIPRTAASTFELGIAPLLPINSFVFSIIFFALVFLLTYRPSKVIDIIGKFLTPALYIGLLVLIINGIISPLGPILVTDTQNTFATGIMAGYQTMDVFGAIIFTVLLTSQIKDRGYTEKQRTGVILKAGLLAAVGLTIVYGGLSYLGATASSLYPSTIGQSELLLGIVDRLMGNGGTILLGLIVALACLTTAVGLTSATAEYFAQMAHNKVRYTTFVAAICVFSACVANFGISTIIAFSSPILAIIYPAILTLIFLSFFSQKITNDNVFKFASAGAFIVSTLTVLSTYSDVFAFINVLPLSKYGFSWVLPTIAFALIGAFIKPKTRA